MRVPLPLTEAYGSPFEALLAQFLVNEKLISSPEELHNPRFLKRSVIPHVQKLSQLFNRREIIEPLEGDEGDEEAGRPLIQRPRAEIQSEGLDKYWKDSSNPKNLRLAYFLSFMPANQARVATVWSELHRLGFRWNTQDLKTFRGIELGAGPATGACGILTGEKFAPTGLPDTGNFALLEQDKATLELGCRWVEEYFPSLGFNDWSVRPFHRSVDLSKPLLPRSAPSFHLWLTSYFLNESSVDAATQARILVEAWDRHLEEDGLVIFVEPALKQQSRRLLELRRELLKLSEKRGLGWLKVLTPCLGHQTCGALAAEEDWCHDEAIWWRPPYLRKIDQLSGLDRRTLPFSHLVITKSGKPIEEILPALKGSRAEERYRLVSPSHHEGRDLEFFLCGQEGKRRARWRPEKQDLPQMEEATEELEGDVLPEAAPKPKRREKALERGDILIGAEVRGDFRASRVEHFDRRG